MTETRQTTDRSEPIRTMRAYETRYFPERSRRTAERSLPPEELGREIAKSLLEELRARLQSDAKKH